MIELPTLETDKFFLRNGYPTEVDTSKAMLLCEKLEQERDWAIEKYKLLESCFKRAERERDEAREQIKELIYIGERAIDLADIDFENDKFGVVSELRDDLKKIKEGAK